MPQYRRIGIIEAYQIGGTDDDGLSPEIEAFMHEKGCVISSDYSVVVPTLLGPIQAHLGDWIVKTVDDEITVVAGALFAQLHERAS